MAWIFWCSTIWAILKAASGPTALPPLWSSGNDSWSCRTARKGCASPRAFLNYGYAILYNKVEKALLLAGIHPHIGLMHADGYQRKILVFDIIECFRNWIEKIVFKLFTGKKVSSGLMTYQTDEGLWLAEGGRRLMAEAVKHRFHHKRIAFNNRFFSLDGYLLEFARRFAAVMLTRTENEVPVQLA
jgi:CRISPR-associated protein Cas1